MNTTPKVSVIIPAYNAEKFLQRCLDSMAAQTLRDIEVIVVNDGSKDATGRIADAFAEKDPRFRVIHQENRGVAVARQEGVDACRGEYTIQVDADDWMDPDSLEELSRYADRTAADMVIFDWIRTTREDGDMYECQRPKSLDTATVFGQMMQPELHASLANKLVRRDCYVKYGIRMIPGMLMEDQYMCLCLLSHPIKVEYMNRAFYHYDMTQNPQSTVNKGVPPAARIKPLELIAESADLTPVQDYYDKAVLYIAYEALFFPKEKCPDYAALFKKHVGTIKKAKGLPLRAKWLVLLRIYGINIPIRALKKFIHR